MAQVLPDPSTYMSPRNVDRIVTVALARQLWLKYGARKISDQASIGDLRALPTRALDERDTICTELVYVRELQSTVRWSRYELRADDGEAVFRPADVDPALGGRWLAAPFRDFDRRFYLQHCQIVTPGVQLAVPPDSKEPSLLGFCEGKLPAIFICLTGKTGEDVISQEPGALRMPWMNFTIKVVDRGLRGEPEARLGSPFPDEAAEEPGASAVVGDIEWYLRAHQNLGGMPGVGPIKIGEHSVAAGWGKDHRVMDTLQIQVRVQTEVPNIPQDLLEVRRLVVQPEELLEDLSQAPIGNPQILSVG